MNGIGCSRSQVLTREKSSDAVGDEIEARYGDTLVTEERGVPLCTLIPVEYSVKNIKSFGTIRYSAKQPAEFRAERGYDWNVGL